MNRPLLEVRQRCGGDRGLAWMARELAPWWEVRAARHVPDRRPAARFVVVGPRHDQPIDLPADGVPLALALRADDLARIDAATLAAAAAIVTDRPPDRPPGPPVHLAPPLRFDPRRWRPAAPLVRAGLRRRLGVAAAALDCRGPAEVDADALRLTAVAIVDLDSALPALALATPCVTDPVTAATLEIVDGEHAVVVDPNDAPAAAADLIDDVERGARLSRNGRLLVEARHDDAGTAMRVSLDLGVDPWASHRPDVALLGHRLWELGAPGPVAEGASR